MTYRTPLWTQGASHDADVLRQLPTAALSDGVPADAEVKVSPRLAGANMSVDVSAGRVVVAGYVCWSDAVVNLAISAPPPPGQSRIDSVRALVVDDNSGSGAWSIVIVNGTSAVSPTPPAAAGVFVELARVTSMTDTTSITAGNIEDRRPFARDLTASNRLPPSGRDGQAVFDSTGRLAVRTGGAWVQHAGPSQFGFARADFSVALLSATNQHVLVTIPGGTPGGPVAVTAVMMGTLASTSGSGVVAEATVEISLDNGATWAGGHIQTSYSSNSFAPNALCAQFVRSGTPSGAVKARVIGRRTVAVANTFTGDLQVTMVPA